MAILAAGINFGKPNTEFIVESDENGVAQSCRNVDTGVEYVGGGGSSDFSTAEVTISLSGELDGYQLFSVPQDISANCDLPAGTLSDVIIVLEDNSPGTFNAVLYQGKALCMVFSASEPAISGNATIEQIGSGDDAYWAVIITGDCSITT